VSASPFVSPDDIRAAFSHAMSAMYRAEVPLYGDLVEIVEGVNAEVLRADPGLEANLERRGETARLSAERHGAIRVGTAAELAILRRAFAVMGMAPVGYYDLSLAGVPVHSTAFRPTDEAALRRNPFRVFTSLLRIELIEDAALRETAQAVLEGRDIVSPEARALLARWEAEGGLTADEADRFVAALLETFRWHGDALVDGTTYARLHDAHRLVADVVSFRGPHINHLTPRTLDIDAAQAEMVRRGMAAKAVIEGPPPRAVPILLRQTSFTALDEPVRFAGTGGGTHTARFGEIEQRGVALTRKGRALYDRLLDEARGASGSQGADYAERLARAFQAFPDSEDALREQGLAYFRYRASPNGTVVAEPITYEDFLPVSAAGIFQSNLGGTEQHSYAGEAAQRVFEEALGCPVLDPFALYDAIEQASVEALAGAVA